MFAQPATPTPTIGDIRAAMSSLRDRGPPSRVVTAPGTDTPMRENRDLSEVVRFREAADKRLARLINQQPDMQRIAAEDQEQFGTFPSDESS